MFLSTPISLLLCLAPQNLCPRAQMGLPGTVDPCGPVKHPAEWLGHSEANVPSGVGGGV